MGQKRAWITVGAHRMVRVVAPLPLQAWALLEEEGRQWFACSSRSKELRIHKTLHLALADTCMFWEQSWDFFLVFTQKENKYIFLSVVGSSMLRVCRSLPCSVQHLHRNSFLLQFFFRHACSRAGVSDCCSCFLIYRNVYLWHLAVSLKAACLPKNISPNDCCRK